MTPPNDVEKVRRIILNVQSLNASRDLGRIREEAAQEIHQYYIALFEKLVGEDEDIIGGMRFDEVHDLIIRNQLRQQLTAEIKKLGGR